MVVTHTDMISPMDPAMGFGPESYHGGDYTLGYGSISENAALGAEKYLAQHP